MLLRRITEHVKAQNWFAVFLDLVIVVIGVFMGIQVSSWNDTQSSRAELRTSLERLDKEVSQNIGLIDAVLTLYEEESGDMKLGREALNACEYSPEGQAALERLFHDLTQDVQPNFITVALAQIAGQGRYQELLSAEFQESFGSYAGRLNEEYEQLTSHYENMWRHHVNFHPDLSAYFPSDDSSVDGGWGFKLDKPFDEICADASFRNRFINTLGFYTSIRDRLGRLKTEVETFQKSLAEELDRQ